MFKKNSVGNQLPVQNNQYYLTVKFLKKLTNGDTVKLDQLICSTGKILKLTGKDEKDTSKLYLGSTNHHPINSTFVRYFRLDGKPEEMRVDKLLQVSFFHRIGLCTFIKVFTSNGSCRHKEKVVSIDH